MKIIDATWEIRNLGVSTQEVEISEQDKLEDIESAINRLNADYQVVKVCTGRMDVNALLAEHGFYFAETAIRVSHNLKLFTCSNLISRVSKDLNFVPMTASGLEIMREQIKKGMFYTDRISLDSEFSKKLSARRYIYWIEDELKVGSQIYTYEYRGQSVGFCLLKECRKHYYYSVLSGVYNLGIRMPFGSAFAYKQLEVLKQMGAEGVYSYISINNPSIVRVHAQYGYVFADIRYVFVRHVNR